MFGKRHLRARVWAGLVALSACRRAPAPEPVWSSPGELAGVEHVTFRSPTLQRDVGAVVLKPPGYDANAERRYPVVYVFPGIGGNEWAYLREMGVDSPALSALRADAAKAPLVVFGNPGDSGAHQQAAKVLADELVGFIDQHYRTRTDAEGRSLEGFSLGGATALNLLLQRPDVYGRAVASSSACYLLPTCGALREGLVTQAKRQPGARVLLAVGAREQAQNRAISEELAPLLGVQVQVLLNVDHDWKAQLSARARGDENAFGQKVAAFHLAGFEKLAAP